jgi:hypothetical protein
MSFQQFFATFEPYVNKILRFKFEISDPVFWVFILIIFLLSRRIWGNKKSLSFSLVVAAALVINTHIEEFVAQALYRPDDLFRFIVRGVTILFIAVIGIYYTFLKSDY